MANVVATRCSTRDRGPYAVLLTAESHANRNASEDPPLIDSQVTYHTNLDLNKRLIIIIEPAYVHWPFIQEKGKKLYNMIAVFVSLFTLLGSTGRASKNYYFIDVTVCDWLVPPT